MKKVALISLGCAKNLVDSEVMLGYLQKADYQLINSPQKADIIIVNTCGFIEPARKEALQEIRNALVLKRKFGGKRIVVAGCYVERFRETLRNRFPEVDFWLGVKDFDRIVEVIEGSSFPSRGKCFIYDHRSPRLLSTPSSWAYVKISEGCSHQCSFCTIPLIKGPYQSRGIASIVEEVQHLADLGVKEINLVSQDTTYYGRDLGFKDGLAMLLESIVQVKELEWIRILYSYPEEIDDSLLDVMQERKICSYLDIPFQHADPQILRKMKRSMEGKRALALIDKIRKKLPDVALRTSLIVGFPGERKEEFDDLKRFVLEAEFDHLGVFTYSREKGTEVFPLGDPVKENVKKRRRERLLEIQAGISYRKNQRYVGQRIPVLVDRYLENNGNILVGRAPFQAPEVDGVVFIEPPEDFLKCLQTIQKVEILAGDVYDLQGRITP